jgi:hypothetical protein
MSLTKKQLDNIRRRAERGSGAWTGEAIYDWRKLLVELDRLSLIEIKYDNLCPVLNEQAGEIERLKTELAAAPRVMIHEHWNAPYTGSPDEPQERQK